MKLPLQYRRATIEPSALTARAEGETADAPDPRTATLTFSSETPVRRYDWMQDRELDEILGHAEGEIRLDRLRGAGPLLFNHDTDRHLGRVETVDITPDGRATATVRFSNGPLGQEKLQDVRDGILREVSVGYRVHTLEKTGTRDGVDQMRAVDWEPLEISLVTIPADTSVGVGRGAEAQPTPVTIRDRTADTTPPTHTPTQSQKTMSTDTQTAPANTPPTTVDLNNTREEARQTALREERDRVKAIRQVAERFADRPAIRELATRAIEDGQPLADFQERVLIDGFNAEPVGSSQAPDLGEMERSAGRKFSFVRAVARAAAGKPVDGFEGEVSAELTKRHRLNPDGFVVPSQLFGIGTRTMQAEVDSTGGYVVGTDILGSEFIDELKNLTVVERAGARRLSGLTGNVAIPKKTAGVTTYWLGENEAVTASDFTLGQITLTPHRLAALTKISKQLIAQASVDVEAMVRMDQSEELAIAMDAAALDGSGTDGEPKGLFQFDTSNSGINTVTYGGAAEFADLISAEQELAEDNYVAPGTWIISPATYAKFAGQAIDSGSGRFMVEGGLDSLRTATGRPALISNQLPSNQTVLGAFREILLADWAGIDVVVDPYSSKSTGYIEVQTTMMCDVGVRYPQAFVISTDSGAQ